MREPENLDRIQADASTEQFTPWAVLHCEGEGIKFVSYLNPAHEKKVLANPKEIIVRPGQKVMIPHRYYYHFSYPKLNTRYGFRECVMQTGRGFQEDFLQF